MHPSMILVRGKRGSTGLRIGALRQERAQLAHRLVQRKQLSAMRKLALTLMGFLGVPASINAQVLTLDDAVKAAEANNRALQVAQREEEKARDEVQVARTYRMPVFSVTALGS